MAQGSRDLIAASLASGFGGLASLFLSSEVGNESVRWLNTDQFEQWPVLSPDLVSREDREAVLLAYRIFRKLLAQESHLMDATTTAAWLDLTTAVAKAAGLSIPDDVAREGIEIARQTWLLRADRQALALAGRTRTSVRRGTFTRQIYARLETSPAVPPPSIPSPAGHVRSVSGHRQCCGRAPSTSENHYLPSSRAWRP